jgi:spermidine synthase
VSALAIYAVFTYSVSFKLALWAFAFVIGILSGMEIPILVRINRKNAELKDNLSDILFWDYIGALVGGLAFTYFLLTMVSLGKITIILGIVNLSIAALGLYNFRREVRLSVLAPSLTCALVILCSLMVYADDLTDYMEQKTFVDPIVLSETSKYQHVVLTERGDRFRMYINGRLQFDGRDEHIYHEMLVHPAMLAAHRRSRVLVLGGGDGLGLREILKYGDVSQVTLVDIDPLITKIATKNPELIRLNDASFHDARVSTISASGISPGDSISIDIPLASRANLEKRAVPAAKVNILNVDADLFLRNVDGEYDVIIIDFPDPGSVEVAKLYSVDFYSTLARRLAPGGMVAIQSTSPYHAKKVFLCIGETLRAAGWSTLPYHQNVPSFGEWGWHLAWRSGLSKEDVIAMVDRELPVETRHVNRSVLATSHVFGKNALIADVRPNSKMFPVAIQYHRESWK